MELFRFWNRIVTYDAFLNDLAARIVRLLKAEHDDPEFISQRRAFEIFGRRNVERWRKQGKITPCKRPGKVEYKTSELRFLQRTVQDYFNEGSNGDGNNAKKAAKNKHI